MGIFDKFGRQTPSKKDTKISSVHVNRSNTDILSDVNHEERSEHTQTSYLSGKEEMSVAKSEHFAQETPNQGEKSEVECADSNTSDEKWITENETNDTNHVEITDPNEHDLETQNINEFNDRINNDVFESENGDTTEICYQEIDGRFVIGKPAGTFEQIPFITIQSSDDSYHRPDIIADIAKINNYLIFGASIRGESHYANKVPRQDSFIVDEAKGGSGEEYAIAIISDGVGNSSKADQFADFVVNYAAVTLKESLNQSKIEEIDWDQVADKIWKASLGFCYQESGSKNVSEYIAKWAGTLEFFILDTTLLNGSRYVHVTVAGDGGAYLVDSNNKWRIIKHGKRRSDNLISNTVSALPIKPEKIIVNKGNLNKDDIVFITTDGLGDAIEVSPEVRKFLGDKIATVKNLPEFIRVVNVAIKQFDDDKTGILIKKYD